MVDASSQILRSQFYRRRKWLKATPKPFLLHSWNIYFMAAWNIFSSWSYFVKTSFGAILLPYSIESHSLNINLAFVIEPLWYWGIWFEIISKLLISNNRLWKIFKQGSWFMETIVFIEIEFSGHRTLNLEQNCFR